IEDKFFDLGGHSLLAVKLISQIEKTFSRRLRLATIFQAPTVEQLAAIIREEIAEGSAIAGTSLVEIQSHGTRPPLFFIHGAGGGMFWGYVNLSRYLDADQPVYGLRSRGLDGREELDSIEEMAAQYIEDIRAMQPNGPYHLGGYCFGGNVAFEVARQLKEQSEEVALVALFNSAPANSSYGKAQWTPTWAGRFLKNLFYWFNYYRQWTPPQRREFFRWKRESLKRRLNRLFKRGPKAPGKVDAGDLVDLSSYSSDQRKLWEKHIHALLNYHPKPFPGRVHLFRSPGHPLMCSFETDYGWGGFAQGVSIGVVPGVHEKILEEPCVQVLAGEMKKVLAASRAKQNGSASAQEISTPVSGDNGAGQWFAKCSGPAVEFPLDKNYAHHFEAQAARNPLATALRFQGEELTYAAVNERANQLAYHLQSLGVGPEALVAVCLERTLELPIALLAVLKAGGAYLPLDRSYPRERLDYMLNDSGAKVLITTKDALADLNVSDFKIVCLDDAAQQQQIRNCPAKNPFCRATPDNLAYVIYTSGSTGQPKGVQITQRSLLNHNFAVSGAYRLGPSDRVLQFSPVSFDISVEEIFPSLLSGCAVVLRTDEVLSSTLSFLKFVAEEQLTVLNLPTAYWHEIVEHLENNFLPPALRLVVIGGEKASDEAWHRWKQRVGDSVTLINSYGPTETTVIATLHVARPDDETLPIGRPIANMQALILDTELQPAPLGETGELHLGGIGIARGYLNRPELTEKKFIPNPFKEIPSARLYKTGDLARFRDDGALEFVGRIDEQVKIRGFRIELGEIESALRSHPGLKEAVVVAREEAPGKKKLVAYFVPRDSAAPNVSELLNFVKGKLPNYMVPSAFVKMGTLPMTPAGKVDRRGLPDPGDTRPELDQQFVAPRTPIEEVVARIWSDVLGVSEVGVLDNFFDLGGHSLLATQVISRMREELQVEVPLANLFRFPTVSLLSEHLVEASNGTQPVLPVSSVSKAQQLPLTPGQWRTWFLDLFEPGQSSYNIPTALRLKGALNLKALEQSLTELSRRHDALRAVFPIEDGQSIQLICEPRDVKLPVIDLSHFSEAEREAKAAAIAEIEGAKPYVMSRPLLRTRLIRFSENDHLLLLITHQVACDWRSLRLIVEELSALYDAFAGGHPASLPAVPMSYADAMTCLQLAPDREREQLNYWKRHMEGAPALLELPTDHPRAAHQPEVGDRAPIALSKELTAALDTLGQREQCTAFEVLLAAFQTLLSRYTGSVDIVIGSSVPLRPRAELDRMVGKFDNLVPLRTDLSGDPSFREFLSRVREVNRGALANSGLLFERLLSELQPERNASYSPIFQVILDYYEEPISEKDAGGIRFIPGEIHNKTSKLDLKLHLARTPEGFAGWVEYCPALFDAERISRMVAHFETLLAGAVKHPEERLSLLPLLSEHEANQVLVEWNATDKEYPDTVTLAQLFEAQVACIPDAVALIAGTDRLSYRELNARANQVAHELRALGIGPGVMAGICLERSWRLLVAILGVLKAGGAYVPLDPAYPKDRLAFILEDAKAPVLLTQNSLRGQPVRNGTKILCLDSDWEKIRHHPRENISSKAQGSDLAYIIYTSGSTGKPKGVAIEHRNAVALVAWAKDVFTTEELAGVLASTSICFDLSVFEFFVTLSHGGAVILADNALALPGLPAANEVTLINTVPSAIRELLRIKGVPASVRVVNLAGEPLVTPLVDRIYGETTVKKVYDLYGPSETTTYSTFTLREAGKSATIGKPLTNEQVYLLDANRQPVPIGVPGELYIGGAGVARGYLNRPELTAEKFVENPFTNGAPST
ncbi:MAG: hypothetical protein QOD03_1197, partial [Verrucomicrobiota bacterium]